MSTTLKADSECRILSNCVEPARPVLPKHYRHLAVGFAGWPDSDLYIMAKCRQEFHQAAGRETAGTVAHEQGHVGLLNAQNLSSLRLRKFAFTDNTVNLKCQAGLHYFLLGIWEAKVSKHIAGAIGDD